RGAVLVPARRLQPVADELLVVRGRIAPRLVLIDGPEARAVGRQDFVDEDQLAAGEPAPFELGVGDDDAFAAGAVAGARVDVEAAATQFVGGCLAGDLDHRVKGDVLVVAGFLFGRGREDRLGKFLAFAESGRQAQAADRAVLLVLLQSGAGEVAAHDA